MSALHGEWVQDNSLDPTETWATITADAAHLQYIETANIVRIEFNFEIVIDGTIPADTFTVTIPLPTPPQVGPIDATDDFMMDQTAPATDKMKFARLEMSGSDLTVRSKVGVLVANQSWRVRKSFFYRTG